MVLSKLNSRQATIVYTLLEAGRPLSAKDLGKQVGTSSRIVRYNLPYISTWLQTHGAQLVSKSSVGISLVIPEHTKEELRSQLRGEQLQSLITPRERLILLAFELLTASGYRSRKDLALDLSASQATLSRDIKKIETQWKKTQLRLERMPHKGVKVVGPEDAIRHTIITILLDAGLESALLNLCLWGKKKINLDGTSRFPVQEHLLRKVIGWNLPDAWRYINEIKEQLEASFSESTQLYLSLYWALLILRLRSGRIVQLKAGEFVSAFNQVYYRIVEKAAGKLYKEVGIQLPKEELAKFSIEMLGVPVGDLESIDLSGMLSDRENQELEKLAKEITNLVGRRMQLTPANAEMLIPLSRHLQRTSACIQHGLPIRNPLKEQIRKTYPDLWEATSSVVAKFTKYFQHTLPPDEIANLTLYMALAFGLNEPQHVHTRPRVVVTCPKGGVAVMMLLSRIQKELPEIDVIDVVPVSRLGKFPQKSIDAIICTIRLDIPGTNVITVSPLLPEKDIALLREKLGLKDADALARES